MRGNRRDLLVGACAVSAGVHAALVPAHGEEGIVAGAMFAAASLVLLAVSVALTLRPGSRPAAGAAAVVLGGLVLAYVAAATVGLPLLGSESRGIEALALGTKVVEGLGLLLALGELRVSAGRVLPLPFSALIAAMAAFVTLGLSGSHVAHGDDHAHPGGAAGQSSHHEAP